MTWTKLQMAVVGTVVVGAGVLWWNQNEAELSLREQNEALQQQIVEQMAREAAENRSLTNQLAAAEQRLSDVLRPKNLAGGPAKGPVAGGAVKPESSPAPVAGGSELLKSSWGNAGFATPEAALRSRGWAVMNGDRQLFAQSVHITDGARKMIEDMMVQMASASTAPDKERYIREAINNKYGAEEALLMPMTAENQDKTYTGYRILSQEAPSPDELVVQVETDMASAPAKTESLKFQHFGEDWKVVVDEDFIRRELGK